MGFVKSIEEILAGQRETLDQRQSLITRVRRSGSRRRGG